MGIIHVVDLRLIWHKPKFCLDKKGVSGLQSRYNLQFRLIYKKNSKFRLIRHKTKFYLEKKAVSGLQSGYNS
jgi:hypothetical protein